MAWVGIPSLKPCTRLYARLHNPASLNVSVPALMLRVRPRYSSIRSFVRIGASIAACTDCEQHPPFMPCLALSQLFAQSELSRLSLHIRLVERGSKVRKRRKLHG